MTLMMVRVWKRRVRIKPMRINLLRIALRSQVMAMQMRHHSRNQKLGLMAQSLTSLILDMHLHLTLMAQNLMSLILDMHLLHLTLKAVRVRVKLKRVLLPSQLLGPHPHWMLL